MGLMLLGKKIGMTRLYNEDEQVMPVTVIQCGPCVVTQIRTPQRDGYAAVQIGFDDVKPRRSTRPMIGHDAKAETTPKRHHREFLIDESEIENYTQGQTLTVQDLSGLAFVDVAGTSKGKGFQGVMKRHHFSGQEASHGVERKHRGGGSIGGGGINLGTGPKLKKGKRMSGHMGDKRITVRSLDVVKIIPEENLILVKGPVPGANTGLLEVRTPTRLYKNKSRKQKELASA